MPSTLLQGPGLGQPGLLRDAISDFERNGGPCLCEIGEANSCEGLRFVQYVSEAVRGVDADEPGFFV